MAQRHKKMLPEGAREVLLEEVNSARDRMTVEWLSDGGLRIGEFCGLHLVGDGQELGGASA
ncbi:hypothetical protein HEK616_83950 (plasmid) [Streptomyces nigrescens]|uniref:Integrase n=1 Tax=Streptomyces nigrescens TaxID=1920 RepID=A0ABM8A849_STRNI|nr:hypothetical protein [Streptomyces nigrescens]BDM74908.1 hypothetical protein HEK616_83950 [Streptomyces nigrescens]